MSRKRVFNEEQVLYLKENFLNMTYREMSELELFSGITEKQIRSKARGLGLRKNRSYNTDYFSVIDTPEKAYFLGFIYADGYIIESERNSELGIEIHQKDKEVLERFNAEFNNVHNLKFRERDISFNGYDYTTKTVLIRLYSKKIVEDLKKLGIVQNKTYSNIFPKITGRYFWDFLRGYFDGDGSIFKRENYYGVHFTNAEVEFLSWLKEMLKNYDVHSTIYKEKEYKYRLYIKNTSLESFLRKLYNNFDPHIFSLKRKNKIAKEYIGSL